MTALTVDSWFAKQQELGSITLDDFRRVNGYKRAEFFKVMKAGFFEPNENGVYYPKERFERFFKKRNKNKMPFGIALDNQADFVSMFGDVLELHMGIQDAAA